MEALKEKPKRICIICGLTGHTPTKCKHLDRHIKHIYKYTSDITVDDHASVYSVFSAFDKACVLDKSILKARPRYWWLNILRAKAKANSYKKAGEKRRGQMRTRLYNCGYCRETGHNRSTCVSLIKSKELILEVNEVFRSQFREICKTIGFGTGALIKGTLNSKGIEYNQASMVANTFPDTFLGFVSKTPFKDVTVFSIAPQYEFKHPIKANIMVINTSDSNLTRIKARDEIEIGICSKIFDNAFCDYSQSHPHLWPGAVYDFQIISRSLDIDADGSIDESEPWFLELVKKKTEWELSYVMQTIRKWFREHRNV